MTTRSAGPPPSAWGVAGIWVMACGTVAAMAVWLEVRSNLFDWEGLGVDALVPGAVVLAALVATVTVARRTRDATTLVVASGVTAALATLGLFLLAPEETSPGTLLGRSHPSPWWFRAGLAVVLLAPSALLLLLASPTVEARARHRARRTRTTWPAMAVGALAVAASAYVRQANDPAPIRAAQAELGGVGWEPVANLMIAWVGAIQQAKSPVELVIPEILDSRMAALMPGAGTTEARNYAWLVGFFSSPRVTATIQQSVRRRCAAEVAAYMTYPTPAHACVEDALRADLTRATQRRRVGAWGLGAGGIALAFSLLLELLGRATSGPPVR